MTDSSSSTVNETKRQQYLLAGEIRRVLLTYAAICDGPTLEALGLAAGKAMALAESGSWFDWGSVDNLRQQDGPE
jgi:hypothetical protein